jgi:hypothetical protein
MASGDAVVIWLDLALLALGVIVGAVGFWGLMLWTFRDMRW